MSAGRPGRLRWAGLAVALGALAACTPQLPLTFGAPSMITVTDEQGVTISLPHPATRIVVLGSYPLDPLAQLGVLPVAMAATVLSRARLPQVFGARADSVSLIAEGGTAPVREIARLKPDLVIANFGQASLLRTALAPIVPLVAIDSSYGDGYNGALHSLGLVGTVTGLQARAAQAAQGFQVRLDSYQARVPVQGHRPSVLVMTDATRNFRIATSHSTVCAVLDVIAGCRWNVPGQPHEYASYPLASVAAADPDIIFVRTANGTVQVSQELAGDPDWRRMQAVRAGRIYPVTDALWVLGGTLALGYVLDEAGPRLYPKAFPTPLP
jgi:ABC-type Fe3+-hydroxamate transport system substrate-binding protein